MTNWTPDSPEAPKHLFVGLTVNPNDVLSGAMFLKNAVENWPDVSNVMISMEGFDDDPRELDQIPEAATALCVFGTIIGPSLIKRLHPEHAALVMVCMGWGSRSGRDFIIHPPLDALPHGRPLVRSLP